MFDLEKAITRWRATMCAGGFNEPASLDELEGHLRDDVKAQTADGISPDEAFTGSVARLGHIGLLKQEFDKVGGASAGFEHIKGAMLTLAGISNPYLNAHMNSAVSKPNFEPSWATYMRAILFVAPAVILWAFSRIYLFPKLQVICREAGLAMPSVYGFVAAISDHFLWIALSFVAGLILLEKRWSSWPRWRRASLGGAVFVVNAGVLLLITAMVVLALLAAPALMRHGP